MTKGTLDKPRLLLHVVYHELHERQAALGFAKLANDRDVLYGHEGNPAILADYEEDVRNGEALVEFTENLLATYDMYVTHAASDLAAKGASYLGRDI
jgi:hypothetical protein